MNTMKTNPSTPGPRDGIHVPANFASELAERATRAAVAASQRRVRMRRLTWTATAVAAVFAGVVLNLNPQIVPAVAPAPELTVDDAWTALDEGQVTLTDDELFELAETHGITTL
jgi:hypothetical protein